MSEFPTKPQLPSPPEPTPLGNGYELVDGVKMHAEQGDRFQIPHANMKRHVGVGDYVEVRIDSARFSIPPEAHLKCECPQCNEPTSKPVLCHEEPDSLQRIPPQSVPARGWGEQFWVNITARAGEWLMGSVDNPLHETKLHNLKQGDPLILREDHILAVHRIHHHDLLRRMSEEELIAFGEWLQDQGFLP